MLPLFLSHQIRLSGFWTIGAVNQSGCLSWPISDESDLPHTLTSSIELISLHFSFIVSQLCCCFVSMVVSGFHLLLCYLDFLLLLPTFWVSCCVQFIYLFIFLVILFGYLFLCLRIFYALQGHRIKHSKPGSNISQWDSCRHSRVQLLLFLPPSMLSSFVSSVLSFLTLSCVCQSQLLFYLAAFKFTNFVVLLRHPLFCVSFQVQNRFSVQIWCFWDPLLAVAPFIL